MRKKSIQVILGLTLAAMLLAGCGSKKEETGATANPGILRVGIVNGGDRYANSISGAPVGIEPDIANLVADTGGYAIQFSVQDDTDALIAGLRNGEYDLVFGRIPQTDQRIVGLPTSNSYGKGGFFLLTPRYNYMDCLTAMQGGTLGISTQTDPLKDEVEGIDGIVKETYPSLEQLGKEVASGELLAGLVSEREAVALIDDSLQAQELLNSPKEEYVAVMPEGSKLKDTVNEAINQYKLNKINQTEEQ